MEGERLRRRARAKATAPPLLSASPLLLALLLASQARGALSMLVSKVDLPVMMQLKKMYISKLPDLKNWDPNVDCDKWKPYATCDYDRIGGIYFQGTWLKGPFPSIITKLDRLRLWYGDANNFTGTIPEGLSKLTKLQVLRLSGNLFKGSLPASFSNLKSLYKFYVKENHYLTGTIPSTWSKLNLQEAYFDSNSFSGPFPTVVCNWSILQRLRIGNNRWTGTIPNCLTKLTNMVNLFIDGIGPTLKGTIPSGIGALTNLELLFLGGNALTGPIPESIGNLKKLDTLFLSANKIKGPLPKRMGELKKLTAWVMEFNQIDGTIPQEIGKMTNLQRLLLDNNKLTGTIPATIANLKQLTILLLEGNSLYGTIPTQIPRGLPNLKQFNVADNWLAGFPPTNFASNQLYQINIRSNYFTGGTAYKTTSGKPICPNKVNSYIISSSAFNCLTKPSLCGPKYDELQRRKGDCPKFCGADGPRGACDGKGYCRYTMYRKARIAICDCFRGYHRKLVKANGFSYYTCAK